MEDDIHMPTVPSGPTTNGISNGSTKSSLSLAQLMEQKDRLEAELKALGSVLDSHGVNMTTSLLTFDGYPRSDIDVAQVRTTRSRINHLKTDYRATMTQLEKALHQHFAGQAGNNPSGALSAPTSSSSQGFPHLPHAYLQPFARVNTVAPDSPAATATLEPNDLICRFGDATHSNHDRLSKIAHIVQTAGIAGEPVSVVVRRDGLAHNLTLQLKPRNDWGGRGMLGCHIVPL